MKEIQTEYFGIARKIVSNMTAESWETIPHACLTYEANATNVAGDLKRVNKRLGKHITINTLVLKIIVEGIKACPAINGHIEFKRKTVKGRVTTYENIDVSMPCLLSETEMMTINLKDMQSKTMTEMQETISDALRRAKNTNLTEVMYETAMADTIKGLKKGKFLQALRRVFGSKFGKGKVKTLKGKEKREYYKIPETERLTSKDIEQGTITISNLGSVCRNWKGECTLLEIVPPQLTAIGVGALQKRPIVNEKGKIDVADVLPLTIAFDHRALDFCHVVPFINRLDEIFAMQSVPEEWI